MQEIGAVARDTLAGKASLPHVVIVGGGFGGLRAARELGGAPVRVTLLDRSNHHVFQPLLYQVATAGLAAPDIATPIRQIVRRQRNTTVLLAEVAGVDLERRHVLLAASEEAVAAGASAPRGAGAPPASSARLEAAPAPPERLAYDHLILAPGAVVAHFGHSEWAAHAPGLKTCADALDIRRRILLAYEAAERETDAARRTPLLTFAVVGGGPTGVELAGALADIARRTLSRNFRRFDARSSRIVLLEAGPRLLPAFAPELSAVARGRLEALGVEVRLGASVTAVDGRGLTFTVEGGAERLPCATMLWAAGVAASPLLASLGLPLERGGRIAVNADLTLPGHPEVALIGDAAALPGVPGLAPAALQMGAHAARNLRRALAGQATEPFRYRDKGNLATIGRSSAVAQFGARCFSGVLAWLLWVGVHIAFLIGFRNRFLVLFEWAWLYVTQQRGARVILEPPRRDEA